MSSLRRKPGPKPKGVRKQFTMRLPADQFAVYKAEAEQRGTSLADYLTEVLARGHGLPEPEYLHRRHDEHQQVLPLTGTG
jgi:hypothetical protein